MPAASALLLLELELDTVVYIACFGLSRTSATMTIEKGVY